MIKSISNNAFTLATFAVACTLLVVVTDKLTAGRISQQQQLQLVKSIAEISPEGVNTATLSEGCRTWSHPTRLGDVNPKRFWQLPNGSEASVTVYEAVAPDGYSGSLDLLVAVDAQDHISGVRVTRHSETPGLGDKVEVRKSDWILSFNGRWLEGEDDPRWAVTKDGGEFDAFTGATITPRAVIKAVKNVLVLHKMKDKHLSAAAACLQE